MLARSWSRINSLFRRDSRRTLVTVSRSASTVIESLEERTLLSAVDFLPTSGRDPKLPPVGTMNPLTSLPQLESRPSAQVSVYLDFDGHTETGSTWNTQFNVQTITTPAYDIDNDPATFSDEELRRIEEIWYRAAEDFSPFDINVTTIDPGQYNDFETILVSIGGDGAWSGLVAGGVAFLNAFSGPASNTAWAFTDNLGNGDAKATALTISHEAGHTLGLNHHSEYDANGQFVQEYHPGTATLGPLMGAPFNAERDTWNDGPTNVDVNTLQDDLAVITGATNRVIQYRQDLAGNTIATAQTVAINGPNLSLAGVIEQNADVDYFAIPTEAGPVRFTVSGLDLTQLYPGVVTNAGTNVDLIAELYDAAGTLLASDNPTNSLSAQVSATVPAGTVYLAVRSTGEYGAIGQFTVDGSIVSTPGTPVMLAPTGQVNTSNPTFRWQAATAVATYELEVTDIVTQQVVLLNSGIAGTTHVPTTSLRDGAYTARVRGVDSAGQTGAYSNAVQFTVGAVQVPGQVTLVSPTGILTNRFPTFVWQDTPFAETFELQVDNVTTAQNGVINVTGITGTNYTTTQALPSEGQYRFRVRAVNTNGEAGPWSSFLSFNFNVPDPAVPQMLAPDGAIIDGRPTFRWTTVTNAVSYELWVTAINDPDITTDDVRVIFRSELEEDFYRHFNALPDGAYYSIVRARNEIGETSDFSEQLAFIIDVPVTGIPIVTAPIGTVTTTSPTISWTVVGGTEHYDLWVNNLSSGEAQVIRERALTTTQFTPDFLAQGTYRVWVRALNSSGESRGWSDPQTFSVELVRPTRPVIDVVDGSTINTTRPTFAWTSTLNAEYYDLWVNNTTTNQTQIIREERIENLQFTATKDLPEGDYRAWVRAVSADGQPGQWSSYVAFTITVPTPGVPAFIGPRLTPVGTTNEVQPTFAWTTVKFATRYELIVNKVNASQTNIIHRENLTTNSFTAPSVLAEGTYVAFVRAFNGSEETTGFSEGYQFTIDVPVPGTPTVVSPVGTLTNATPTFSWTRARDAARYQLFIRNLTESSNIVVNITNIEVDPTQQLAIYTLTQNLTVGSYQVFVRAFNGQGESGGWSRAHAFSIAAPASRNLVRRSGAVLDSVLAEFPTANWSRGL